MCHQVHVVVCPLGGGRVWVSLEGVHPEGHVHPGAVGQEGSQGGLLEQPEDQDLVPGEGTPHVRPRPQTGCQQPLGHTPRLAVNNH